jgi:hypothetical protein
LIKKLILIGCLKIWCRKLIADQFWHSVSIKGIKSKPKNFLFMNRNLFL